MAAAAYHGGQQQHHGGGGGGGGMRLGGGSFNHRADSDSEQEYDRLRNLARQEHAKMSSCFDRAHQSYGSGNGADAHSLSAEGKQHQEAANRYNKQASDYIFRANNAEGRVAGDTIDLHGQFVEEAEEILEQRIKYAKSQGQTHLHVIVGKGNHSPGHIQKIKPRVEKVCQELGLNYSTEANAGRIYVDLQGGPAQMPPPHVWGDAYNSGGHYGANVGYPGQPGKPQQQFNQQQGGQQQQDPIVTCLKLLKSCCTVM